MVKILLQTSDWIRLSDWECNEQTEWTRTRSSLQYHQVKPIHVLSFFVFSSHQCNFFSHLTVELHQFDFKWWHYKWNDTQLDTSEYIQIQRRKSPSEIVVWCRFARIICNSKIMEWARRKIFSFTLSLLYECRKMIHLIICFFVRLKP